MKEGGRAKALLVELMIVIFFFMIASMTLVELFASSKLKSMEAKALNDSMLETQNIADELYGSENAEKTLTALGFQNENNVWTLEYDGYTIRVTHREEETESGILDTYDEGEYLLGGTLIRNLSETRAADYRNRMIGFIFQSFNLISFKNAVENVALPLFYQGVSRRRRNQLAMEYLDRLGLRDWAHHYPSELSGGQKQRVAIARALITQPRIILADEPTGALDSHTSLEVMQILKDLHRQGMTIVVVTHESGVAYQTEKIVHIKDGIIERIEENLDPAKNPFGMNTQMK